MMHLEYFGLDSEPFTISPDPSFLYPSAQHRKALVHLKYGVDREGGFIVLTGEVGTGKTTLTRLLLEQLPSHIQVAYVLNTKLSVIDVLASICQELGIEHSSEQSIKILTDSLNKSLLAAHAQGKKTLLVIEEAQNLAPEVLETLRLLTNLETNKAKLLHVLLVGQPELLELIARKDLRQLNQRVVSRFHIEPLSFEESKHYLNHRLRRAGCSHQLFDSSAVKALYKCSSEGIPRLLNLVAERSLLGAYAQSMRTIDKRIVKEAAFEVFGAATHSLGDSEKATGSRKWLLLMVVIAASVALGLLLYSNASGIKLFTQQFIEFREQSNLEKINERDELAKPRLDENAYTQLLGLWGVEQKVGEYLDFCTVATEHNLLCHVDKNKQWDDILILGLPMLVNVSLSADHSQLFAIKSIGIDQIHLHNSQGVQKLTKSEFEAVWDNSYIYLWEKPPNYTGVLIEGMKNIELMAWLQQKLERVQPGYEGVISAGLYSKPVVDAVKAFQLKRGLTPDGVLGPNTLVQLNDSPNQPTLQLTVIKSDRTQ